MDEYTPSYSHDKNIIRTNDGFTEPYNNIYLFSPYSSSTQSKRKKLHHRSNRKRNSKKYKNKNTYKIKPIFKFSRVYKRTKEYRRLVENCNSKQKNRFQYYNEVSINCIINKPIKVNENNNINHLTKNDFIKNISIIAKCYDKFPIIKSKWDHSISICKNYSNDIEQNNSTLIESKNGLDVMFNISYLIDVLSCPLCKGLYYNAHTIKECMHTFCKSCLILSTLENGPLCPLCFISLENDIRESIEYDHNIQAIVDKIFPKFSENENKQIKELNRKLGIFETESNITDDKKYNPYNITKKEVVAKPSINLVDSTSEFIKDAINEIHKIGLMFENVLCLALIHESDNQFYGLFKNVRYHMDQNIINRYLKNDRKYPRRFICVPKKLYLYQVIEYLIKELVLEPNYNIVLTMSNKILLKNQTLEFICKSRNIDMSKCVIFRYKITRNNTTS